MPSCQRSIPSAGVIQPSLGGNSMTERTVRQVIEGQEPVTAPATMTVAEAANLMKQHNIGALTVIEADKLVGVFTERDALFRVVAGGLDARATHLSDVMTRNPKTSDPNSGFTHALQVMHDGHFRHLPVVENGR